MEDGDKDGRTDRDCFDSWAPLLGALIAIAALLLIGVIGRATA